MIIVSSLLLCLGFLGFISLLSYFVVQLHHKLNLQQSAYQAMQQEFDQIVLSTQSSGQRMLGIENAVQNLLERQNKLDNQVPQSAAYSQAAKLVEMGASAQELKDTCGLGTAESELLMLMHKKEQHNKHSSFVESA